MYVLCNTFLFLRWLIDHIREFIWCGFRIQQEFSEIIDKKKWICMKTIKIE